MKKEWETVVSRSSHFRRKILLLLTIFIGLFLFAFSFGRYSVPFEKVIKILLSIFFPIEESWDYNMEIAVLNIRFPRVLLASMVGACLAVAGSSFQSAFYNPMSSPDILGATSGAAFGAALAIILGLNRRMVILFAFFFSLATVALVYLISKFARGDKVIGILLAGIMVSSIFSAGVSYLKLVADPTNQLPEITYWLMGSFNGSTFEDVAYAFYPMLMGLIPLFLLRWRINMLTLGDDEAETLGINTRLLRFVIILASSLITAVSVSASGMIGWVGLVIPHLARRVVGNDCRYLLPASFIMGAGFLLLVDTVSRNLLAVEIPIGILTSLIGAPFFLYLMTRKESVV